jgi:hypothetical protein
MKDLAAIFVSVIFFIALGIGLTFLGYESYQYFAPRYAAVDNKVFHESAQYNDGMVRDLENVELQYQSATSEQKQALRAVVLHRFSVYPEDRLPANLRNFYDQLKGN